MVGDLERNGSSLALSGYAKAKHFGRLAYMPLAYKRYLEHKARDAQREAAKQAEIASQHVGEVGQRITPPLRPRSFTSSRVLPGSSLLR